MKYAADFRREAREALRGKWVLAILAGVVAMLLGGTLSNGPQVNFSYSGGDLSANLQYAGQNIYAWGNGITPGLRAFFVGSAIYLVLAALVLAVLYFILGSVICVGYARFNLDLTGGEKPPFETLFTYFYNWKTLAVSSLLRSVYILLWSLLLIVPGIMATYSYAMTDYILAEHPELTASEAIAQSKAMMDGSRWRLFCLHLSFIGWDLLCALTLGLGNLALTPYKQAAEAAFYRDLCGGTVPAARFLTAFSLLSRRATGTGAKRVPPWFISFPGHFKTDFSFLPSFLYSIFGKLLL